MNDYHGQPVPVVPLVCPRCSMRHEDTGEWANKIHKTHRCAACGREWDVIPPVFGAAISDEERRAAEANIERLKGSIRLSVESAKHEGFSFRDGDMLFPLAMEKETIEQMAYRFVMQYVMQNGVPFCFPHRSQDEIVEWLKVNAPLLNSFLLEMSMILIRICFLSAIDRPDAAKRYLDTLEGGDNRQRAYDFSGLSNDIMEVPGLEDL